MSEFKALILSGTLKPKGQFSHTETLAGVLIEEMKKYDIESEIVRLNEYKIPPGVESKEGESDEWPKILEKILGCHILIFATPIWWGPQSSLIQRAIERMDALNDELLETGKSELANKVGGIVITGAEDGAQHIIGCMPAQGKSDAARYRSDQELHCRGHGGHEGRRKKQVGICNRSLGRNV